MANKQHGVVEPGIANMLAAIASGWVTPRCPDRVLASPVLLADIPLGEQWAAFTIAKRAEGSEAEVRARLQVDLQRRVDLRNWKSGALQATTDDGWTLEARSAYVGRGSSSAMSATGPTEVQLTISLYDWTLVAAASPPRLWVATIEGNLPRTMGNLLLTDERSSSWGHMLLRGSRYTYYLLSRDRMNEKGQHWLAVEVGPDAAAPDPYVLNRELPLLDAVMGAGFGVSLFYGLDDALIVRGLRRVASRQKGGEPTASS